MTDSTHIKVLYCFNVAAFLLIVWLAATGVHDNHAVHNLTLDVGSLKDDHAMLAGDVKQLRKSWLSSYSKTTEMIEELWNEVFLKKPKPGELKRG